MQSIFSSLMMFYFTHLLQHSFPVHLFIMQSNEADGTEAEGPLAKDRISVTQFNECLDAPTHLGLKGNRR